jgi:hypothetical protein
MKMDPTDVPAWGYMAGQCFSVVRSKTHGRIGRSGRPRHSTRHNSWGADHTLLELGRRELEFVMRYRYSYFPLNLEKLCLTVCMSFCVCPPISSAGVHTKSSRKGPSAIKEPCFHVWKEEVRKLNVRRPLPVLCHHIKIQQCICKHELYLSHRKESSRANSQHEMLDGKNSEPHR